MTEKEILRESLPQDTNKTGTRTADSARKSAVILLGNQHVVSRLVFEARWRGISFTSVLISAHGNAARENPGA